MGLTQHEHFSWARTQGHPADDISAQVDQAVRSAVYYELTHDTEDIDEERRALARRWINMARTSMEVSSSGFLTRHSPLALSCRVVPFPWYVF